MDENTLYVKRWQFSEYYILYIICNIHFPVYKFITMQLKCEQALFFGTRQTDA